MKSNKNNIFLSLAFYMLAVSGTFAAITNETSRTLDSAGNWSGTASLTNLSAVGQGCPVGNNTNALYRNYSGFLQSFVMSSGLDNDNDGIPDENDADDDNDGLTDTEELTGSAFNPATPTDIFATDTDDDGFSDVDEAGAGTNPQDSTSLLNITSITQGVGNVVVTWSSRDTYQYEVLSGVDISTLITNSTIGGTVTASGGSAPWWQTQSLFTNAISTNKTFYKIRVK